MMNWKKWMAVFLAAALTLMMAGCSLPGAQDNALLLHLAFDEGSGTAAVDSAGKQEAAEVSYLYTNPVYTSAMEPEWRTAGVEGGALLFDGTSTCLSYKPSVLCVSGEALSVTVWVAPRAFEWDDPNAADNGTESLTAIVGQYNADKKQGFLLGYQRFGRLCFQVGDGQSWYTVWADKGSGNLNKYQWNYVTAVFDGANGVVSLYLNGALVGSGTVPAGSAIAPAEKEKLLVGKNARGEAIAAGAYNMFCGLMDELKLYSKALTAEEAAPTVEAPAIAYEDIALTNLLTEDIYKTQYHGGPYQHWMNEPHSPVYYNGMYHLFFQQNIVGTYWRNICWGHLVSADMVNWYPVKEAITPTEDTVVPDGVWSGNAALDVNGVPLLFFTAGNDSYAKDGLISNQNIGIAYPADLSDPELTEWVIYDELAVVQQEGQGRPGEFRDPYLWQEDGAWFMLICSGSSETTGGSALLYKSETLELKSDGSIDMDWQYIGPIYEMENQPVTYGTSWELPILLHLTNQAGTITKDLFLISPAPAGTADNKVYYFLGTFDAESGTFTPDEAYAERPGLLDYGDNVFTGPSVLLDPVTGTPYVFSIMQDKRGGAEEGASGWAHCVGLTRQLWLSDDGAQVKMSAIDALHGLEEDVLVDAENLTLEEANEKLSGVKGDLLYIRAALEAGDAAVFGIRLKGDSEGNASRYWYDAEKGTINGLPYERGSAGSPDTGSGALALEDGTLTMEIYIDRSLVEGFFNDTKSISMRSYSEYDAQGVQLYAEGEITVKELYVAQMGSIYSGGQ